MNTTFPPAHLVDISIPTLHAWIRNAELQSQDLIAAVQMLVWQFDAHVRAECPLRT